MSFEILNGAPTYQCAMKKNYGILWNDFKVYSFEKNKYIRDPKKTQAIISMFIPTIHNTSKCLMGAGPLRWHKNNQVFIGFCIIEYPWVSCKMKVIIGS
jgi:hypothetical protein